MCALWESSGRWCLAHGAPRTQSPAGLGAALFYPLPATRLGSPAQVTGTSFAAGRRGSRAGLGGAGGGRSVRCPPPQRPATRREPATPARVPRSARWDGGGQVPPCASVFGCPALQQFLGRGLERGAALISISGGFQVQTSPCTRIRLSSRFCFQCVLENLSSAPGHVYFSCVVH